MSDGPHRTLPMRPLWRALAECADNQNFTLEQVAEAVCPALASDWRAEVSDAMVRAVGSVVGDGQQISLFANQADELSRLRAQCGSPMEALLVDTARDAMADGLVGPDALKQAIVAALIERALRDIRSIEEHYLRASPEQRAARMRSRLETSVSVSSIPELARAIADGAGTARRFKSAKRDGLDEGVPL